MPAFGSKLWGLCRRKPGNHVGVIKSFGFQCRNCVEAFVKFGLQVQRIAGFKKGSVGMTEAWKEQLTGAKSIYQRWYLEVNQDPRWCLLMAASVFEDVLIKIFITAGHGVCSSLATLLKPQLNSYFSVIYLIRLRLLLPRNSNPARNFSLKKNTSSAPLKLWKRACLGWNWQNLKGCNCLICKNIKYF